MNIKIFLILIISCLIFSSYGAETKQKKEQEIKLFGKKVLDIKKNEHINKLWITFDAYLGDGILVVCTKFKNGQIQCNSQKFEGIGKDITSPITIDSELFEYYYNLIEKAYNNKYKIKEIRITEHQTSGPLKWH